MNRYRPASVLVLAIFNIIFGSLCGLSSLFNAVNVAMPNLMASKQSEEMMAQLQADIPGLMVTSYALAFFSLIMSGLLLSSGLGMLGMKPWARMVALVHGWLLIVSQIIQAIYQLVLVNPATQKAMQMEFQKMPQQGKGGKEAVEMMGNVMGGAMVFFTVLFALIAIGYGIYELVTLMRRPVKDAFAGIAPPSRFGDAYDQPMDRPMPLAGPSSEGIKDFNPPRTPDNLP